jgi:murein DD-endopeptidase MepM/ murein hydrolase activator NlpD
MNDEHVSIQDQIAVGHKPRESARYSGRVRWFFFCMAASLAAAELEIVPRIVRQGETLRIRSAQAAESARMDGRSIRLYPQEDGSSFGLMPVPAGTAPGEYQVELIGSAGEVQGGATVTVRDARFPSQNIRIGKAVSELKPSPGEMETVAAFRKAVSDDKHWEEPLVKPVPGCMTSPFGVRRLHNGKPTGSYHTGLDQRGAAGRPVRATAAGVVRIARMFNVHGGTAGIDHGQGLSSIYLHLSKFAVKEGAAVVKGGVIGYVGSTGRSTAPHLHWSLYVNGVPVNPRQWLKVQPCAK